MSRMMDIEWPYLTDEAKKRILLLMAAGVKDQELAMEMVIQELGDCAFELPESAS